MQRARKKPILVFIFSSLMVYYAAGQKSMYLEDSFRNSSTEMPAKRKGIGAVGKFEFGPFKILAGKQGWTKTEGKSNIRGDSESQSVTKSSFKFQGINQELVDVQILYTSTVQVTESNSLVFQMLTNWSDTEIEHQEFYVAEYDFSGDTTKWSLALSYPIIHDENLTLKMKDLAQMFNGEMVSSSMNIEIVPQLKLDNGKDSSIFRLLEAYTFQSDGVTIGAVQIFPRPTVWIKNDLQDNLKNVLAVSAATLMVRSDQSDQ